MKKIAILVIAAINTPVYRHYISNYWTETIRHTNEAVPNIDVYMLIENGTPRELFKEFSANTIEDPVYDMEQLSDPKFHATGAPGILSKTLYALEQLQDQYDVFYRTNLSIIICISEFNRFVQNKASLAYSGPWAWSNALRENLLRYNYIGPGRQFSELSELDQYEGNSFVSGAGFFLNSGEVKGLLEKRQSIRFDVPDDVSIGLMMKDHEVLRSFGEIARPDQTLEDISNTFNKDNICQFRLQHFPVEKAEALWERLKDDPLWL